MPGPADGGPADGHRLRRQALARHGLCFSLCGFQGRRGDGGSQRCGHGRWVMRDWCDLSLQPSLQPLCPYTHAVPCAGADATSQATAVAANSPAPLNATAESEAAAQAAPAPEAPTACSDVPPNKLYSCAQQKEWGERPATAWRGCAASIHHRPPPTSAPLLFCPMQESAATAS